MNQSSKIIGIMMSDIRTSHHAEGAYFIEQQLQNYGYSCIIVNSGFSEESRENGMRLLASRRAEAVVLIGSTFQSENVKKNIRKYLKNLPIIIENGFIDLPNVYSVLADEKNGIAECLNYLYERGKTNPYFINIDHTPSNDLKIQGFNLAWQAKNPNSLNRPPVLSLDLTSDMGEWDTSYQATKQLLQDHPEVDSIIYSTDLLANAGARALLDCGIRIPEQVSIIGVDNSIYAKICYPRLTSLDNKMQDLSMTCANMLIRILNGEQVPHKLMILSNIVEGETT